MAEFTDQEVRKATNQAEQCEDLSDSLNAMPIAARVELAGLIATQNIQDRSKDETLPRVVFHFGAEEEGTNQGKMHVLGGWCIGDPSALLFKEVKTIYRMPSGIDALPVESMRMQADSLDAVTRLHK